MKTTFQIFTLLGFFSATVSHALNSPFSGVLQIDITPWKSACRSPGAETPVDCDPPKSAGNPQRTTITIPQPLNPGEASSAKSTVENENFKVVVSLFSVWPKPETKILPYLQVQIEQIKPIRFQCMNSVRWKIPFESSPLLCAGFYPPQGVRLGLTNQFLFVPTFKPAGLTQTLAK